MLAPAWVVLVKFYLRSPRVVKAIKYGTNRRNNLDIYVPASNAGLNFDDDAKRPKKSYPVLIFVTGGAWIIGHKCWAALMGKVLSEHGVILVSPDYRNFPQGRVGDMLEDVDRSVAWVFDNIAKFGGDVNRVFLSGQSAGAHLTSLALLSHCDNPYAHRIRRMTSTCGPPRPLSIKKRPKSIRTPTPEPTVEASSWTSSQLAGFVSNTSSPLRFARLAFVLKQHKIFAS